MPFYDFPINRLISRLISAILQPGCKSAGIPQTSHISNPSNFLIPRLTLSHLAISIWTEENFPPKYFLPAYGQPDAGLCTGRVCRNSFRVYTTRSRLSQVNWKTRKLNKVATPFQSRYILMILKTPSALFYGRYSHPCSITSLYSAFHPFC